MPDRRWVQHNSTVRPGTRVIVITHKRSVDVIVLRVAGNSLEGADLSDAQLRGASMAGMSCARINLKDALLAEADLTGADLREANLQTAVLADASLRGPTWGRRT
ncbi:MAG: hypothetical protein K0Q72_1397 [Armatimonadetes bacterium]|nr:hypothetical protein [Armatimonadota bacterium]